MTKEEKNKLIDTLAEKLTGSNNFYLTDVSGLTASDSSALRRLCFNKGVSLQVVKNTLLKNAMEKAGGNYKETYNVLNGNTAILFSETGNVPAKLIKQFRQNHERPILKAAFVEETLYLGDEQLIALSEIKTKNEVIADIIALLQSPLKNVISALQSGGNKLSGILKALSEKEEASAKTEEKAAEKTEKAKETEEDKDKEETKT